MPTRAFARRSRCQYPPTAVPQTLRDFPSLPIPVRPRANHTDLYGGPGADHAVASVAQQWLGTVTGTGSPPAVALTQSLGSELRTASK